MTDKEEKTTTIPEPAEDQYTGFKKDPRLPASVYKQPAEAAPPPPSGFVKKILAISDYERFLDTLRTYKQEQHSKIKVTLENNPLKNRRQILTQLSAVADEIILAAKLYAQNLLKAACGTPTYLNAFKQTETAHLAIVGMGKLGAQKINYHSDLDLIFIYSHRGETQGTTVIDNGEYFVKLAQKFITALSVTTSKGRCYAIDTELRPSGNMGMLVTSYDHFIDHQMNRAQNWERQALLPARPMTEDGAFRHLLEDQITQLVYDRPLPADFTQNMRAIRERVLRERVHETPDRIDIKLGPGSLMDIEFILHNFQLRHGRMHPDLRVRSIFDLLEKLKNHQFLAKVDLDTLTEAHLYYRTIESQLHLIKNRAETHVDFAAETFAEICDRLGFGNREELKNRILQMREEVKQIYKHVIASGTK